MLFFKISLFSI